jgi:hypothetical protein
VAAESEQCEGDEGLGAVEPVRDPGEQPDLGVGRFDQSLGETVVEVGVDRLTVSGDLLGEGDKRGERGPLLKGCGPFCVWLPPLQGDRSMKRTSPRWL